MIDMKILGSSVASEQMKVTLVKRVAQLLDMSPGDTLAYLVHSGNVIIKKQSDIDITNENEKEV